VETLQEKDGRASRWLFGLLLCGSLLAAPLLSLRDGSRTAATDVLASSRLDVDRHVEPARASRSAARVTTTTSTTEAPVESYAFDEEDAEPTTTVSVRRIRATTTTAKRRTTTTTAAVRRRTSDSATETTRPKPKTTTTTAGARQAASSEPSDGGSQRGKASWYEAAPAGTCAHRTIAKGTMVTVTAVETGRTTTCKVADRGPYVDGFIIDLSKSNFSELAHLNEGVIDVRISW
jgi:rare lipoprotein A (peptidoglycan hydrolase)